jgi:hypothetical protein
MGGMIQGGCSPGGQIWLMRDGTQDRAVG